MGFHCFQDMALTWFLGFHVSSLFILSLDLRAPVRSSSSSFKMLPSFTQGLCDAKCTPKLDKSYPLVLKLPTGWEPQRAFPSPL